MSWLAVLLVGVGLAASPVEDAQLAELERVRGKVADQVQLTAFDLVDEMVLELVREPAFTGPTPVVLAGVTVPIGLGTGMQALLENHLTTVLLANPRAQVQLVHCPACTQVVVHAGPEATVVTRGVDNPAALAQLRGPTNQYAMFVDVEAEGSWLVLRGRITRLNDDLPIVWSHTVASSASTPALLRESEGLKTAAQARAEYLDVLRERGLVSIPLRAVGRTYAQPNGRLTVGPPPFLWVQSGAELAVDRSRAWTSSLLVGFSFIPQAYQGIMGQARVHRLITGRSRSLSRPDLYGFFGASVTSVWGPATGSFRNERLRADDVIASLELDPPRTTFGTLQMGLDVRMGQRIGVSMYLESMPSLNRSPNMGQYFGLAGIRFQSLGTEVTLWF